MFYRWSGGACRVYFRMRRKNKVYRSLYKKHLILGVPIRFFSLECTLSGIVLFAIHLYGLFISLILIHIIILIIIKKEAEMKEILIFWLKIKKEKNYAP